MVAEATPTNRRAASAIAVPLCLLFLLPLGVPCRADQVAGRGAETEETLSEEVNDPTASLTTLQLKEEYTPAEYGTNAQPNTLLMRPILAVRPHGPLDLEQIVRPTFSLNTVSQGKHAATVTGFGDMQLFDLFVAPWPDSEETKFRWAIGPYLILPTATNDRVGKGAWQLGGATGFRYKGIPRLSIGALVQQATSVAYTSPGRDPITSLTVQPMIAYRLGRGWYLKSSDATWTFNLRHKTSTEMPFSAGVGKVWRLADATAIHTSFSGEWMAYRQFAPRTDQFTLKFEFTLLFPQSTL